MVTELARVDDRGRILLPRRVRDVLGVRPGDAILLVELAQRSLEGGAFFRLEKAEVHG